jgi:hypothetical protein
MRLMIETLDFNLGEGEVEVKPRVRCRSCGVPVAHVKRGSVNQDGTFHRGTCSHLYANRKASLRDPQVRSKRYTERRRAPRAPKEGER